MGMMVVLLLLPHAVAVTLAVIMAWLMWETGQRVVVDAENRGALYWLNIFRWRTQQQLEFIVPAFLAILIIIIYTVITL
jgi:hypothetical protein